MAGATTIPISDQRSATADGDDDDQTPPPLETAAGPGTSTAVAVAGTVVAGSRPFFQSRGPGHRGHDSRSRSRGNGNHKPAASPLETQPGSDAAYPGDVRKSDAALAGGLSADELADLMTQDDDDKLSLPPQLPRGFGCRPGPFPMEHDLPQMQQDHPERKLLVNTMFLWDMRYLPPATVKYIMVDALDATYQQVNRHIGTFAVHTAGGRAHSLNIVVARQDRDSYTLRAEASYGSPSCRTAVMTNRSRSRRHGNRNPAGSPLVTQLASTRQPGSHAAAGDVAGSEAVLPGKY